MIFHDPSHNHPKLPSRLVGLLISVSIAGIVGFMATAGTLTPSSAPGGTMKTLQEIYDAITGTSFDSSSLSADQNGSLIEGLKYINANLSWASSSNDIYMTSSGNVGIGDSTPTSKLTIQANNTTTDILTIASSSGSEYLSMEYNGHTQITGGAIQPVFMAETRGPTPGTSLDGASEVYVQGKYAYVANKTRDSLAVIDISNPASPSFLAETRGPTPGTSLDGAQNVFVIGRYAYVLNNVRDSLAVIDVSNPTSPTFIAETRGPTPGTSIDGPTDMFVSGKYVYISASGRDALVVIDISNPASPSFVAETRGPTPGTSIDFPSGVFVSGKYAYVSAAAAADGLVVIDISNPASPSYLAKTTAGGRLDGAEHIFVSGRYAYIPTFTRDSLAVIDISNPASPSFVSETRGPIPGTSLDGAFGISVSGRYAYVGVFTRDSLAVIDISNPASPSFVTELRPTGTSNLDGALIPFVSGRYAYVVNQLRDSLAAIDIGSLTAPQIEAGTIRTENLGVISLATFDNGILLKGGISVGEGALIGGHFSVSGASSSFLGKLGVGTTSPRTRFEVLGSAGNYDIFNVASSSGTSLLRITKSGNIGIGTSTPGLLTHIRSSSDTDILRLQDSDGTCDHNPEAGSETVTCSSDQRLKENIVDAPSILSDLAKFRIREFNVISSDDRMIGVIAQEVQSIFPNLVSSRSNGYLAVEQPTTWQLVKGLQEAASRTFRAEDTLISRTLSVTSEAQIQDLVPTLMDRFLNYLDTTYKLVIKQGIIQAVRGVFTTVETQRLKSQKIELIGDEGTVYCVKIIGGIPQTVPGECGVQAP